VEKTKKWSSIFPSILSGAGTKDAGPEEFLYKLQKAKEVVDIPLIASLNAVYEESWVEYAKKN